MVNTDSEGKHVFEVGTGCFLYLGEEELLARRIFFQEFVQLILRQRHISDDLSCACCLLPRVAKDKDLMLASPLHDFFIADLIHEHHSFDSFFLRDSYI